ncbi:MAG: sigma-70 family RNA polymerase sigma factor [Ignavibacteriales bacterium]|nr:sigma-70 family RNA polymerase sigma factor [Ignavibacteriales bacterium]
MKKTHQDLDEDKLLILLEESKEGNPKALGKICEHFYPKIYRFLFYRVNGIENAEDLTGEVCARVIQSMNEQKGSFTSWIYTIASNMVTDHYRRRSVRSIVEMKEDLAETVGYNDNSMENSLTQNELKDAILQLTEEQQKVITLKFIEGYETEEIANMLSKSAGAVRAIQFRALTALRTLFGAYEKLGKEKID